ncbi:hypothetical protein IWQ62_001075 [Dispira parvispora]|uniref:Uncharacterized protein n=1 Tax=Dispira parvispora TaxID=1520584 RepID=A0A9W8E8K7_9FUNG|nr:hypothetical protein IWQ62_001075 [Dispira parvispora]
MVQALKRKHADEATAQEEPVERKRFLSMLPFNIPTPQLTPRLSLEEEHSPNHPLQQEYLKHVAMDTDDLPCNAPQVLSTSAPPQPPPVTTDSNPREVPLPAVAHEGGRPYRSWSSCLFSSEAEVYF